MSIPTGTPRPTTSDAPHQLRELAADPVFARRRGDLESLAEAVEAKDSDSQGWARIDLHAAFTPTSTIHIEPEQGRETLFGALAGASVFLPIIWTWWSLRAAAEAFQALLAQGGAEGQSFIQLWVSGFGGELAPIHQFTTVAFVSVLLIGLAIVLFVVHRVLSDRSLQRQDEAYAEAEARLNSTLALARRALAESILSDAQSFEAIVQTSLQELARAHVATEEATRELSATVDMAQSVLKESMSRIDSVTAGLTNSTAVLGQAATSVDHAAEMAKSGTIEALERFGTQLTSLVEAYQAHNAQDMRDARDALTGATLNLTSARADFERTHQRAVDLVDEMAGRMTAIQSTMNSSVADNLDVVRQLLQQMDTASDDLRSTLARLEPALAGNQSALQAQASEITRASDVLTRLSDNQYAQHLGQPR